MHAQLGAEALARDDLKDVSSVNIVDGSRNGLHVPLFADVRGKSDAPARTVAGNTGERPAQLLVKTVYQGTRPKFVGVVTDFGGRD